MHKQELVEIDGGYWAFLVSAYAVYMLWENGGNPQAHIDAAIAGWNAAE